MPDATRFQEPLHVARAHHAAGRLPEAEQLYRRILAEDPDHADALHMLGVLATQVGRADVGLQLVGRASALRPNSDDIHSSLGNILRNLGRYDEAIAAHRRAIAIHPAGAAAHSNFSCVLREADRPEEAAAAARRATELAPGMPEAHNNLGSALLALGRFDEAVAAYRTAMALRPGDAQFHCNLGNGLMGLGDFDAAAAAYRRAIELRPSYPEAIGNLGAALGKAGRLQEAIETCRAAIALKPELPQPHVTLGTSLLALRRVDEALAVLRRLAQMHPDFPDGRVALGHALLLTGDYVQGWDEYEWRWRCKDFPARPQEYAHNPWDGSPLAGRTLLLYAEQGLGDTIHFARYLRLVARAAGAGRVIFQCEPELRRLLQPLASQCGCELVGAGEPRPHLDVHCSLLSLPRVFRTSLASVPANVPYLVADPACVQAWRRRLDEGDGQALRVGLAWAGNPKHKNDVNRSLPLTRLAPLFNVPGVRFVSLQKGAAAAQARASNLSLSDMTEDLRDFADTAGLVANLDLVITVDTAVAHLAGAMAKEVWTLLPVQPDWRWMLGRDDSPWYPTMRLFRQDERGQWDTVVDRLVADLAECVAKHRADPRRGNHAPAQEHPPSAATPAPLASGLADADAQEKLGNTMAAAGRWVEAAAAYQTALAVRPNNAGLQAAFGCALQNAGHVDEAVIAYRRAIGLDPNQPAAQSNLGVILLQRGQLDEAITACQRATELMPDYAVAHFNLGCGLKAAGRLPEAIAAYRRAIALKPGFAEAHSNLGTALKENGDLDEAICVFEQAVRLKPEHPICHANLGAALGDAQKLDQAIAASRRAIALQSDFAEAHYNLAMYLLSRGDMRQGWEEYEWRWRTAAFSSPRRNFPQARWDGGPLPGRTLMLYAEQGLGDTLQFVRYLPRVAQFAGGGRVVFECPAPLLRLFRPLLDGAGVDVVPQGQPLPPFDLHCPLLTLPSIFGTTLDDIPGRTPYLEADPVDVAAWARRLAEPPWAASDHLKVGLVWAGNPAHKKDRERSMPLSRLAPVAAVPGVRFVSLQKGASATAQALPPPGMSLFDATADLRDMADTAALVANLDLVIAVDTAVAHMAGAMAKPVWTLLPLVPDWRWLLRRDDSPWYPTMRLFRQERRGDWDSVVARVTDALALWATTKV